MNRFRIAHIREQGVDLIIIPLDRSFAHKSEDEQHDTIAALQLCAQSAGLRGHVVPVWDTGGGRMAFIAHPNYHPFFTLQFVHRNINRELTCG
jgi:hypothetical protein